MTASYIATQVDIIQSQSVALQVAESLERDAGRSETDFKTLNDIAGQLLRNLHVEPSRDSRVMQIHYEAKSPNDAAKIANAFVDAYVAVTLKLSTDPARRNAEWFDKQLVDMRQRLEQSQDELARYQQEKGIIAISERLKTEAVALEDLTKKLTLAKAEVIDMQGRQLGANHPSYRRALNKQYAIQNSIEERKGTIHTLKQQREAIDKLERQVAIEQQNYDSTLQGFYQSRLQSQLTQTNISVLNRAVAPSEPSSPNLMLNMVAAAVLGLVLGIVIAILTEMLFRRVRTDEDAADILGAPVLASI
jgi:uncharacterized protein involved in exopolysaccharide biosynthesis